MAKMNTRTRWLILGSLLTATLVAVVSVDEKTATTANTAEPVDTKSRAKATDKSRSLHLSLERLERNTDDAADGEVQDAFKSKSWYVPPPPPKPAPPPPPSPPPLPFKYIGKMVDEGETTVFLGKQNQNYAVKAGDTIDGTYLVEQVDAQQVRFMYLPLKMKQTLAIGGVN